MLKNVSLQAYLDDYKIINVYIANYFYYGQSKWFKLKTSDNRFINLNIIEQSHQDQFVKYKLNIDEELNIGDNYTIIEEHGNHCLLEYRLIVKQKRFDQEFYCDRDDFGSHVIDNKTKFVLWAPTANKIVLGIVNHDNSTEYFPLIKGDKGCWEITVNKNCHGFNYYYLVSINGAVHRVLDPYSYGLSVNSEQSVVIDFEQLKTGIKVFDSLNTHFKSAVICEVNVRDFSSSNTSNSKFNGKFLGLIDSLGRFYLNKMPITHVQLMPVNDFWTVDDTNAKLLYNWGYDPYHYFGLEGSYCSNPLDPLSRVNEFISIVNSFHEDNILVNLDVVFNHVYDSKFSYLDKIVPFYYFRMNFDGVPSNGSFCGNDIESRHLMVRKLIVDSLIHFINHYDIDGFRFDLMGILDIDTMNEIYNKCSAIKPYIMIYGEGWNMPTMIDDYQKAMIDNNKLLPNIGFFNDYYRDNVKGPSSNEQRWVAGYCLGDVNYFDNFASSLLANCSDKFIPKIYQDSKQTINYIECHDNMTLWDKINDACRYEDINKQKNRQKLCLAALAFSQGNIFFQFGQEHCRSKNGYDNTYNLPDSINNIDYQYFYNFEDVANFFNDCLNIRKKYDYLFSLTQQQIQESVSIDGVNGALKLSINYNNESLIIVFNPTNQDVSIKIPFRYKQLLGNIYNDINNNVSIVSPISCGVWYEENN